MHSGQLKITEAIVANLVATQFPQWADLPVRTVRSHGTVNALFRVGDDLVARLPLVCDDPDKERQALEVEAEAARRLAQISPVRTPRPVGIGDPGAGYPAPWAVYYWLPGSLAGESEAAADSPEFAHDLAHFILALREVDTAGRVFTGAGRGGLLSAFDEYVRHGLARSESMIDTAALRRVWADVRTASRTEADTWSHGDLMPGNLLVDGDRLVGVIDVGQFGVADPALDLQPAWNLMRPQGRSAFRAALGSDDDEWARGKGWALAQAIGCLWYYRETNPAMSRTAHTTLSALLQDATVA
jgi:aminoglycoside phosphotransferase (APT) family kinase protein